MKQIIEILQDKYQEFEYKWFFIRAINIFNPLLYIYDNSWRLVYQSQFKSRSQILSFIDKNLFTLNSLCEKI